MQIKRYPNYPCRFTSLKVYMIVHIILYIYIYIFIIYTILSFGISPCMFEETAVFLNKLLFLLMKLAFRFFCFFQIRGLVFWVQLLYFE